MAGQVNDPLRYKGITMYQTDWGLSSVIVRAQGGAFGEEGVDLQLPMASLEGRGDIAGRIWGSFLPTGQDGEKRGMCVPLSLSLSLYLTLSLMCQ
jgi:hypothetical protein